MRTNIDIDDGLMSRAMQAGPYKTKKDAVEAGLKLLARQAAYREVLKWEGKLHWEGDESSDWSQPAVDLAAASVQAPPAPRYVAKNAAKNVAKNVAKTGPGVKAAKAAKSNRATKDLNAARSTQGAQRGRR
jgi:antitoxin ParD1/3/4